MNYLRTVYVGAYRHEGYEFQILYNGESHVAMYVGGGRVVAAPETGEDVQIQPIWDNDLVGAGRP